MTLLPSSGRHFAQHIRCSSSFFFFLLSLPPCQLLHHKALCTSGSSSLLRISSALKQILKARRVWPNMHTELGSIHTAETGHGGTGLHFLSRWTQEDQKFNIILSYLLSSKPAWITCKWEPVSNEKQECGNPVHIPTCVFLLLLCMMWVLYVCVVMYAVHMHKLTEQLYGVHFLWEPLMKVLRDQTQVIRLMWHFYSISHLASPQLSTVTPTINQIWTNCMASSKFQHKIWTMNPGNISTVLHVTERLYWNRVITLSQIKMFINLFHLCWWQNDIHGKKCREQLSHLAQACNLCYL